MIPSEKTVLIFYRLIIIYDTKRHKKYVSFLDNQFLSLYIKKTNAHQTRLLKTLKNCFITTIFRISPAFPNGTETYNERYKEIWIKIMNRKIIIFVSLLFLIIRFYPAPAFNRIFRFYEIKLFILIVNCF